MFIAGFWFIGWSLIYSWNLLLLDAMGSHFDVRAGLPTYQKDGFHYCLGCEY